MLLFFTLRITPSGIRIYKDTRVQRLCGCGLELDQVVYFVGLCLC